jgi:uncharacterized protein YbcV (DUF1398 family)
MLKKEQILKLLEEAKANKWYYPKTFAKLKSLGVIRYEVSWNDGYKAFYFLEQENFQELTKDSLSIQTPISNIYHESQAKQALHEHQQGKTDFFTLLNQLAEFGISHYMVNMKESTVTYYSIDNKHFFVENVPEFKDGKDE